MEKSNEKTASKKRNAFDELLSPKPKQPKTTPQKPQQQFRDFTGRHGLAEYIDSPTTSSQVIYHTDDFVAINDLFPKSQVHTLLIARKLPPNLQPVDAFDNAEFLASVRAELPKLKKMAAAELRRKFGQFSAQDRARERILNGEDEPGEDGELPEGRDWTQDIKVGVHARPSMAHLHVHVMSTEHFSERLKHRKHYNSFNTPFFIPIDDFPLAADDDRRDPDRAGYLDEDMRCWRCRKSFGNKFKQLHDHLQIEFDAWKRL